MPMKTFRDLVVVKHPLDQIWTAVRDRLPELADHLDDIESIACLEHERVDEARHRLVNGWQSTQRIPAVLQSRLGTAEVAWIDRNEWDDRTRTCTWAIEPSVLPEHIRCAGRTIYGPAMGGAVRESGFPANSNWPPGRWRGLPARWSNRSQPLSSRLSPSSSRRICARSSTPPAD
jgi:hypothetical protein